jgi:hypothetical protein
LKIWFSVPGLPPISVLNEGGNGDFVLPAGTDINLGPKALLSVDATLPRGTYEFSCRLLDPFTGELLAQDVNTFEVKDPPPPFALTPDQWTIELDTLGPGIHSIFMIARASPLTVSELQDFGGRLVWDQTQVELCTDPAFPPDISGELITVRDIGNGFLKIGDGFETNEQASGCNINAEMQNAFDNFGLPGEACISVRTGGVDYEYCAPLNEQ